MTVDPYSNGMMVPPWQLRPCLVEKMRPALRWVGIDPMHYSRAATTVAVNGIGNLLGQWAMPAIHTQGYIPG